MGNEVTETILATLALEAHAHGVSLPAGKFTTTSKTVNAQWKKYIAAACGKNSPLNMHMSFEVSPTDIKVCISPSGTVNRLRMRPTIEALNKAHKGLGWWVYDTASQSDQHRYPIYRLQDIADFLQYATPSDDFSDEGVLREHNECNGEDLTMEEFQEEYQAFWPSKLIEAVDGHTWLLGATRFDCDTGMCVAIGEKPYIASFKEAQAFVKGRAPKALRTIVQDFIALHEELNRPESLMKLAEGPQGDYEDENYEPIGASCALVWDSHEMPWELIQHHETELQNHGEYTDEHIVFQSDAFNQVGISRLIQSIKDFVTRHSTISKAFSHFEVIK